MSAPVSEQQLAEIEARRAEAVEVSALACWPLAEYKLMQQSLKDSAALLAEVRRLREERHETNEALSDAAVQLRVQRDRIAELEAAAVCPSVARLRGSRCVLPVRHRGDHQDETKRHYWSDEYAVPQQRQAEDPHNSIPRFSASEIARWQARQQEDPHTSELHHDYTLGRDDVRFIPQQVTGRCPKGHTFEDCTCGGAA